LYLRNGNHYLESMIGAYRARVTPFNVNYRYVDAELADDSGQIATERHSAATGSS
jgi:acyl-CoA synthetase (AMP-forming)/AMP-acid ligase II